MDAYPVVRQWFGAFHAWQLLQCREVRCRMKTGDERGGIHALFQSRRGICKYQFAAIDDLHTVTGGLYFGQYVGGKNNAVLLAEFADQVADFTYLQRVKSDRRFIQDNHGRAVNNGLCNTDALLIALGKVADQPPARVPQSAAVFRRCDRTAELAARDAVQFCAVAQVLIDRQFPVYRRLLG